MTHWLARRCEPAAFLSAFDQRAALLATPAAAREFVSEMSRFVAVDAAAALADPAYMAWVADLLADLGGQVRRTLE